MRVVHLCTSCTCVVVGIPDLLETDTQLFMCSIVFTQQWCLFESEITLCDMHSRIVVFQSWCCQQGIDKLKLLDNN